MSPRPAGEDAQVRAVVSRVSAAAVTVDGAVVGAIDRGLLALGGAGSAATTARASATAAASSTASPAELCPGGCRQRSSREQKGCGHR